MEQAQTIVFQGNPYRDYKHFFSELFSNTTHFQLEFNLDGHIEVMVVKSTDRKDFLKLELLFVLDNGKYHHLFDVRFKHPHSPGYTKLQDQRLTGFDGKYDTFNSKNLEEVLTLISERISLGWAEDRYFKNGKYYKSKIMLPSYSRPRVQVYRREPKSLAYILLSTLVGKWYRQLHRGIKVEPKVIQPDWHKKTSLIK